MPSLNEKLGGKVTLTYFQLGKVGGRGGPLRFLLLAHNIDYDEDLLSMSEWGSRKKQLIETGVNPCGAVPLLKVGDRTLYQSISIMRYICAECHLSSSDPYKSYQQDALADEVVSWRSAWVSALFAPAEAKEAAIQKHKDELPKRLTTFEAMYTAFTEGSSAYAGGASKPLQGDICVFGQLYDEKITEMMVEDQLLKYPKLSSMYKSVAELPAVAAWIEKVASA